jgi:hypothetical protein
VDAIEAASTPTIWFGVVVLNYRQEVKNRPFWTAPSGLKRAACHVLRLFLLFNSDPTCHSLII